MGLATASPFASFDQSAQVNVLDISPFLSEALIYDYHLLGAIGMSTDNPVDDIIHYWVEDSLNSDLLTLTISLAAADTSVTFTASSAPHVGDYLVSTGGGTNQEIMQVTTVNSTTNVSVSRGFVSTAASIASAGTVAIMRNEQEGSDIGSDASVNPTVRSNYTTIITARDLQISGSQLARQMSTSAMQDQVAHQLENRLLEWKRDFTRHLLYSVQIGPGSDTQYRTLGGFRYWIRNASGQTESTAAALTIAHLNTVNKLIVDQGVYPDLLVCGTDLVGSINGFDSTNRRMLENDNKVGYFVNGITLGQGNDVKVVVDTRVNAGDAFLLCSDRIKARPLRGRALITIAGQDWVDAKKRRILGEWGLEFRNPTVHAYVSNKS
jgi:hypothetical protein